MAKTLESLLLMTKFEFDEIVAAMGIISRHMNKGLIATQTYMGVTGSETYIHLTESEFKKLFPDQAVTSVQSTMSSIQHSFTVNGIKVLYVELLDE